MEAAEATQKNRELKTSLENRRRDLKKSIDADYTGLVEDAEIHLSCV
jgi:hypothetical protein